MLQLRSIYHPHVNTFLGIVVSAKTVYLVSDFCRRGSLPDLEKSGNVDWDFRLALMSDLVEVRQFFEQKYANGFLNKNQATGEKHLVIYLGNVSWEETRRAGTSITKT